MEKKLYRVKKGRILSGVAAGAGEYFDIDPTVVRLIFIGITIAFLPLGLVSYIAAAVLLPEKEVNGARNASVESEGEGQEQKDRPVTVSRGTDRTRVIIGAALLFIGVLLLSRRLFSWFYGKYFWPLLLIAAGAVIIFKGGRK